MTNLNIIREACIKANPEIMEFKFGCEIEFIVQIDWRKVSAGLRSTKIFFIGIDEDSNKCYWSPEKSFLMVDPNEEKMRGYTILGRPIRLADVLLAMEKKVKDKSTNNTEYLSNEMQYLWESAKDIIHLWNLREDDLSKQSAECLEFLANLLKT